MKMFIRNKPTEHARAINWVPEWDIGASMPQVFANGQKTFLVYLVSEHDENWDGTYSRLIDDKDETIYPLALVEFAGHTFRFGTANDEVFEGLPLAKKGLKFYSAHVIENSQWITELKNIHKVHPYYNDERWIDRKHYMLLFHDEIFEVIATGYEIEMHNATFKQMASEVLRRLYS